MNSSEFFTTGEVNLTNCDREAIHLLGQIQPHGVLIVIKESELKIVQISENTDFFFGIPASSLINQPLQKLFPQSQIDILVPLLLEENLEIVNPIKLTSEINNKKHFFECVVHRSDKLIVLEIEPLSKNSSSNLDFYHLAKASALKIRKANDFLEMSNLLVKEIQKITLYDRVLLYRFEHDQSGVIVAEVLSCHNDQPLEPFLGLHYPASDIPIQARKLYYNNWLRLIVDLNCQPVSLIPANNPITNSSLDLSFSVLRNVSPIHIKYLNNMGVSASLGISLINAQKLWGLVVCHHYSPKYINYDTRKICEFLGQIMSVEIVNKHEKDFEKSLQKIKSIQIKLKQDILADKQILSQALLQDQENLLNLVNAQGAVICLGNQISKIGEVPDQKSVSKLIEWLRVNNSQDIVYTNCLGELYPDASAIKDRASGLLAISIFLNHTAYHIIWFRPEVIQTVNWAGDPNKPMQIEADGSMSLSPRRSFELWKETVREKSLPWQQVEIEAALELRGTLMLAALDFSQQALKQEANRTEVASRAKSEFLARMSHELRTPLNAILGCTQLMNRDTSLTTQIEEYVHIISHSSEHLLSLIDDILEISKIEAGQITLEETGFDFHLFLHNILEMLQLKAQSKNLQLNCELSPDLPQYINADERKLRQILLNLLGNAIKFTSEGSVTLRTSVIDFDVSLAIYIIHFEIEDTGEGIDSEDVDKLFQAFVQTKSGKKIKEGTGLGLAISQKFANCMDSHITVNNILRKGMTFKFDIPVQRLPFIESKENQKVDLPKSPTPTLSVVIKTESNENQAKSLRILLAEDNPFNQMIALRFLVQLGYQADCAVNGLEVLKALDQKTYDLILMDVQMPKMDGLEATRQIRQRETAREGVNLANPIKIIAMTANVMKEDRENCLEVGMDDFISKPVRIEALEKMFQKWQF